MRPRDFFVEVLGLSDPIALGPFAVVSASDDTTLDFIDTDPSQHYAFLVSETECDEILARIHERHLAYWADPGQEQRDEINAWDDGRGVYFEDPNGHLLEVITRPYGSGGTEAANPHPLVARRIGPLKDEDNSSADLQPARPAHVAAQEQ